MDGHARWHCAGLRWIGSLFHAAADRLERASIAASCEPTPAERRRDVDPLQAVRLRILSRYY